MRRNKKKEGKDDFLVTLVLSLIVLLIPLLPLYGEKDKTLEAALKQLRSCSSYFTRGLDEFEKVDNKKAFAAFKKCIRKMPRHAYAHYYLANLYYIRKDFSRSLAHMEQALTHFEFMQKLGVYVDKEKFKQMDSFKRTLEGLWDMTNSCRDSRTLEFVFSQVSRQESDLELEARRKQWQQERMKAHYHYFNGNILFQLQRFPEALQRY
jgi:tetratricopeptide (TPR) repeat protein